MQKFSLLILLVTIPRLLYLVFSQAISGTSITTDESILLALKESMNNHVLKSNWSSSSSVCSWIGVTCGHRHQRVTALNISNMGLTSPIPSHLGNLSFLMSLDISNNSIYGQLPEQLAWLRRLNYFNASSNNFNGSIPSWFSLLTKLRHLDLSLNHFTRHIPPEIGNLQKLTYLNFQHNKLTGSIPDTIFKIPSLQRLGLTNNSLSGNLPMNMCSNVTNLTGLYLSYNELDGQIPSGIFQCSRLQILSLSFNNFSGTIPRQIGSLMNLNILYLSENNISGTIPRQIGNLTNLIRLDLGHSNLQGEIPLEIGNLHKLESLKLANASLSGEIPPSIFNISTLRTIDLFGNILSGSVPENIGLQLQSLEELFLGFNRLSGSIPESISNASRLIKLDLASNKFTGVFPNSVGNLKYLEFLNVRINYITSDSLTLSFIDSLTNCQRLKLLWIGENPLNGILPASIGNLSTSLEQINARSAEIRGRVHDEIGNLTSLAFLGLSNNRLTGFIPRTIGRLSKLQVLSFANNSISGLIPTELCVLKNLGGLTLQINELYGSVPSCLGNISSLRYLNLRSNKLNSTIPTGLWSLTDLLELDVSSNNLSGSLPSEVGNLKVINRLNCSMNQFSGEIPSTIGGMKDSRYLSFAFNRFMGPIPESFGNVISLEYLDLSHNNLSGSIPKKLETLSHLSYFNVSFNRLTGEVPKGGPFANITYESIMSNRALCGAPRLQIPACSVHFKPGRKRKELIIVSTSVAVLCILLALAIIFLLARSRRKGDSHPEADFLTAIALKRISYLELERATNQFHESNLIGMGSFASVYKATIEGALLAVKVFKLQVEGASRGFDIECEALRNLHHRNLVRVISSCTNLDFKALILDYMPKGSLEKWLHEDNYFLDLSSRIDIMIDVASALDYLHNGYSTPVVHCDLKPSNVLLDDDMVAHVADFGIAKLLGVEEGIVQTKTLATIGYMAPEYGSEGLVSTKCDIYSYGILLMETLTGKRPTDEIFEGVFSLKDWIANSLPNAIVEIVDAQLLMSLTENITTSMHCIASIMDLAIKCSADAPQERMNVKDVLVALKKFRSDFQKSNQIRLQ